MDRILSLLHGFHCEGVVYLTASEIPLSSMKLVNSMAKLLTDAWMALMPMNDNALYIGCITQTRNFFE